MARRLAAVPADTGATPGMWIGASYALGRLVSADEPYQHICGRFFTGRVTGQEFKLFSRDCFACGIGEIE
jgi:hypothetical protein